MNTSPLTICICGGGNLGHTVAGYVAAKKQFAVNLLTSHPERWQREITVKDGSGHTFCGKPAVVSNRPELTIPQSDIILLCLPGFAIQDELLKIKPFLKEGQIVGSIVSSTGFFFIAKQLLSPGIGLFGFQRVPFISRINEYGRSASLLGYKKQLKIAIENYPEKEKLQQVLFQLLDTPIEVVPHYLEVSLSNSNPLLHTSRLYNLFQNYSEGTYYEKVPLFYEDWTDEDAELLIRCDNEFFRILDRLPVNIREIQPILEYYESRDAHSLALKIRSIEAFKDLPSPMIKIAENKYIPDFTNRYFQEDFSFGLSFIKNIGDQLEADIPNITKIYNWACRFIPIKQPGFKIEL